MTVRLFTVLWIVWGIGFVVLEGAAYFRRSYEDTATWHLREIMLAHPLLFILVPSAFCAVAIHLVVDGLRAG